MTSNYEALFNKINSTLFVCTSDIEKYQKNNTSVKGNGLVMIKELHDFFQSIESIKINNVRAIFIEASHLQLTSSSFLELFEVLQKLISLRTDKYGLAFIIDNYSMIEKQSLIGFDYQINDCKKIISGINSNNSLSKEKNNY